VVTGDDYSDIEVDWIEDEDDDVIEKSGTDKVVYEEVIPTSYSLPGGDVITGF
jgi:hypothetical protein